MPLRRRQFELRVDGEGEEWMRQIYELLLKNRELAYSAQELTESIPPNTEVAVAHLSGQARPVFIQASGVYINVVIPCAVHFCKFHAGVPVSPEI